MSEQGHDTSFFEAFFSTLPADASGFDRQARRALEALSPSSRDGLVKELFYDNHAGYVFMLGPSVRHPRVLYLGKIEGGLAFSLCQRGYDVHVCSENEQKLRFLALRARLSGLADSLHCVSGSPEALPFEEHSFDLVIIEAESFNSSFEQDGRRTTSRLPSVAHRCQGLLKDTGSLLLLTGNKLSYQRLAARTRGRSRPGKVASSGDLEFALRRCLQRLGMEMKCSVGIDVSTGDIWLDKGSVLQQRNGRSLIERKGLKERLKRLLARSRLFRPAFAMLVGKPGVKATVLDEVLERVDLILRNDAGLHFAKPAVESVLNRHTQRLMIRVVDEASPASVLVKVPYTEWARRRELNNFRALRKLHGLPDVPRRLKSLIPSGLFHSEVGAFEVFAETYIDDAYWALALNLAEIQEQALDFIVSLHTATRRVERLSGEVFTSLVAAPLAAIEDLCFEDDQLEKLRALGDYAHAALEGREMPLVFAHGDFCLANLLVSRDQKRLTGVIDWETAEPSGLPLVDLLFVTLDYEKLGGRFDPPVMEEILKRPGDVVRKKPVLKSYLSALDVPEEALPALFLLHWAGQVAAKGLAGKKQYDSGWLKGKVYSFLDLASQCLCTAPHGTPGRIVGTPGRIVGTPGRIVGTPGRIVGTPGRIVGTPEPR